MPETANESEEEAEIYEVDVQLRQSAIIAVEATSREEAWESLEMPHDREGDELLTKTRFQGAEYQPEDIISVGDVNEADITLIEEGGEFYATIEGRDVETGTPRLVRGQVTDISFEMTEEVAGLTLETDDGEVTIGGQVAAYEDVEAHEITIGRDEPPAVDR